MYYSTIEEFAKYLYTAKANSRLGYNVSEVQSVTKVSSTLQSTKYKVVSKITAGASAPRLREFTFDVPQLGNNNTYQVSINIGIINKCVKLYTSRNNTVIGAAFKGLYISPSKDKVYIGSSKFNFNEVDMFIKDPTIDVPAEKFKVIQDFELKDKVIESLKLIVDKDFISNKITDLDTWKILLDVASGKYETDITPYDIEMFDYQKGLLYHLNSERRKLRDRVYSRLNQNANIYESTIANSIKSYFLGNLAMLNMVQYTQDTNPLTMLSQSKKIFFLDYKSLKKVPVNSIYLDGILDPIRTSESVNLINIKNEISLACNFGANTATTIKVFDKDFNEVDIPIEEYHNSAILSYDNINYRTKTLKLNKEGKYKYVKRCRYYSTDSLDDIKYYRHQSSMLSASTALMPLIKNNDVTRDLLQAHFNTQAIPVKGAMPSIIHTSYSDKLHDNTSNIKSSITGKVVDINAAGDKVKVEVAEGEYEYISTEKVVKTKNHTNNIYIPNVKVGDTISEGDVVFHLNSFKGNELAMNVPLLTAFTTLRGREDEDGYVMSQSAAKKLSHPKLMNLKIKLQKGKYILDPVYLNIKSGDHLDMDSVIFSYEQGVPPYEATAHILDRKELVFKKVDYTLPKYSDGAEVDRVMIHINPTVDTTTEDYTKMKSWQDESLKSDREFYSNDMYIPKFPAEYSDCDYVIEISITYYNQFKLSDKITNRASNKGLVVTIAPDEEFPMTQDGKRVEVILPALAGASRKNTYTVLECKLTKLSEKMYQIIKSGKIDTIRSIVDFMYQEVPEDLRTAEYLLANKSVENFMRFTIDPFDTEIDDEKINELLELAGIPNEGREILIDGPTGRRIRTPILVGYNEYMRLHFIAEEKMTATPGTTYTSKTVMGVGRHKPGGQKFGEMETHALMAHGAEGYISEISMKDNKKDARLRSAFTNIMMRLASSPSEDE
jgi:DNA-directed RNA polymerase subunit beta